LEKQGDTLKKTGLIGNGCSPQNGHATDQIVKEQDVGGMLLEAGQGFNLQNEGNQP
jgi:hypothetical protein